jgi:hypothetical protein
MRASFKNIESGHNLSMRDSQNLEIDALDELLGSPDLQEAIESYSEKRRPQFTESKAAAWRNPTIRRATHGAK